MFREFIQNENAAVTVDWVVLTAALVGLGLAVMAVVSGGVESLSTDVSDALAEQSVEFTFASAVAAAAAPADLATNGVLHYNDEQISGYIENLSSSYYSDNDIQNGYTNAQNSYASGRQDYMVDVLAIHEAAAARRGMTLNSSPTGMSYAEA